MVGGSCELLLAKTIRLWCIRFTIGLARFPLLVLIRQALWRGPHVTGKQPATKWWWALVNRIRNWGPCYNWLQEAKLYEEMCDLGSISFPGQALWWDCSSQQHLDCSFQMRLRQTEPSKAVAGLLTYKNFEIVNCIL